MKWLFAFICFHFRRNVSSTKFLIKMLARSICFITLQKIWLMT